MECIFANGTILADPLDVYKTSVGLKANSPQSGKVRQPFADAEVARIIDRGLGTQGATLLVILLDPGTLVVDVQRWRNPLGDHTGSEPPRGALADAPAEDQLHVIGPADVQILADHFLEENPTGSRLVQDLGQRELCLEDRYVVAVAGRAILRGKRVRQPRQPFP